MKFIFCIFYVLLESILLCKGEKPNIAVYSYNPRIVPYLEKNFHFDGNVTIELESDTTVDCLTLNSKNLKIKGVSAFTEIIMYRYYRKITYEVTYELFEDEELLKICLEPSLQRYKPLTLVIVYSGKINDEFEGLTKIQYEEKGVKKWILVSQLVPTYARMVFPCFDEPKYRSHFTLGVARFPNQTVTSITDISYTTKPDPKLDNREMDIFKTTYNIPTNMLSFVLHEFESKSFNLSAKMSVYSRNHRHEHAKYFLSEYKRWYDQIENYLNVTLAPSFKTSVAIPDADENSAKAGLITYKESDILHISAVNTEKHKEKIARTAVHKYAHWWFNGYVTPKSWNHVWLSESFCTNLEYQILVSLQPEWHMDERFIEEVLQNVLFYEDSHSYLALSTPVDLANNVQSQKLNPFRNEKGASMIRMMAHMVTLSVTQNALHNLIENSYNKGSPIRSENLWNETQTEANKQNVFLPVPVRDIMNTWTNNLGYPVVQISTNRPSITIRQEPYRSPLSIEEISDKEWIIPISYTKQSSAQFSETKPTLWSFNKKEITVDVGLQNQEWIICNIQQTGYYRVNYDDVTWTAIIQQLKTDPTRIDVKNRAELIDDAFHLAIGKYLNFRTFFQLCNYLKKEKEMLPWKSFINNVYYLVQIYEKTSIGEKLKDRLKAILYPQYERVGFYAKSEDTYSITTGRSDILEAACYLGIGDCHAKVTEIYKKNINHPIKIPTHLRFLVFCFSFQIPNNKGRAWKKLWMLYKNSKIMSRSEQLLRALGCADDEILLKKYLKMAIRDEQSSDKPLYKYEKEIIIKTVTRSFKGITTALDLIKEFVPKLNSQSEEIVNDLTALANQIGSNVHYDGHLKTLSQIIKDVEYRDTPKKPFLETLKIAQKRGQKRMKLKNEHIRHIEYETSNKPDSTL